MLACGVLAVAVVACSGGSTKLGKVSVADAQYGLAPRPDPSVHLQDDVVIVGGGSSVVRSVSGDGTVWTLNSSAPHLSSLAVGKVMFLTDHGVGRVMAIDRTGASTTVTLAPVDITDVIRDAEFHVSQPVDVASLITQVLPGISSLSTPASINDTSSTTIAPTPVPSTEPNLAPGLRTGRHRTSADSPADSSPPTSTVPCATGSTTTTSTLAGGAIVLCGGGGDDNQPPSPPPAAPPVIPPPPTTPPPTTQHPTTTVTPRRSSTTSTSSTTTTTEPPTTAPHAPAAAASACAAKGGDGAPLGDIVDPLFKPFGLNPGAQPVAPPSAAAAPVDAHASQPKPSLNATTNLTVGPVQVDVTKASNTLTVYIRSTGAVQVGIEFCFDLDHPSIESNLDISNGAISDSSFALSGITRLTTSISAGSETGLSGNFKIKLEVPIEFNEQIFPLGIPMNISVRNKILLETAFSAKNSTILGSGAYGITGPIGFTYTAAEGMKPSTPTITVERKILDSLQGISVGVNGIVIADQIRVQTGFGIAAANAGPYVAITFSLGVTVGSDLGIVKCRGATLDVNLKLGLGFILAPDIASVLGKFNKKVKLKSELPVSSATLFHRDGILPRVPVCGG